MDPIDFDVWLDCLRNLPSDAPQWEQANQFADSLAQIITEKKQERDRAGKLLKVLSGIRENFSGELEFLGINAEAELIIPSIPAPDTQGCLAMALDLESSLVELREARTTSFERLQIAATSVQHYVRGLGRLLAATDSAVDETELTDVLQPGDATEQTEVDSFAHGADGQEEEEATIATVEVDRMLETAIEAAQQEDEANVQEASDGTPENNALRAVELPHSTSTESSSPGDGTETGSDSFTDVTEPEAVTEDSLEKDRPQGIQESVPAAKSYLAASTPDNLDNLFWSLIAEDDLSAAYWASEYLIVQGHEGTIPPELVNALLGSRSLSPDSHRYVADLFEVASKYEHANANGAQGLLEFAASLYPSLIAPHSTMLGLLQTPAVCPAASTLVAAVNEFARYGDALRPEHIEGAGESARRQNEIAAAGEHAKNWLEDAPKRKYSSLMWATNVWKHLTGTNGKISQMLSAVIDDNRTDAKLVKGIVDEWTQDIAIDDINQINQFLAVGKAPRPPIAGRARNWLLNGIEEAKSIAIHWHELVQYENDVQEEAQLEYLIQRADMLRNEMRRNAANVIQALSELTADSNPMEIASAGRCALRSLEQVFTSMDIDVDFDLPDVPAIVKQIGHISRDSLNLKTSVARRLLWTQSSAIDDDGTWSGDSLEQVMRDLAESISEPKTQQQAIEERFRLQDYRFFDIMSSGVPTDEKERLKGLYWRSQQDSGATLENYMEEIRNSKDQAVRDGVIDIDDDNWIMYGLILSDIENALESDQGILNYPSRAGQLEQIQRGLEEEEHRRRAQLQTEWDEEFADLSESAGTAIVAWQEKFSAAREKGNIRVMEECVIRLRNHSLGELLPEPDPEDESDDSKGRTIQEFVAFVDSIQDVEEYARTSIGLTLVESRLASV